MSTRAAGRWYAAGVDVTARRLGRVVQELLGTSYSHATREVLVGHALVNGVVVTDPGALVAVADAVTHEPGLPRRAPVPRTPPIQVLHADGDVVVVNKPAGLLMHPTADGDDDTVVSRVGAEVERRTGRHRRVHVVHRLDRDTSGVLVLALTHEAAKLLQRQFRTHSVERRYLALVRGALAGEREVDRDIGRPRPGARRAALAPGGGGRAARTGFRPLEHLGPATLVEAELGTGRTHQVRVHLSFLGHPVIGDHVYGDPATDPVALGRLALHARTLAFTHPRTGERLRFDQRPPDDFLGAAARLRRRPHGAPEGRSEPTPTPRGPRRSAAATAPPRPRTPRRPAAGAPRGGGGARRSPRPARPRRRA